MANNCLSEPLWQFWFPQGQVNNRWGLWMVPAIAQKGIPRDEASRQMIKYEENAFTSLRELPDPLEGPDELRLTPHSKPTPMHIHFLGTEALLTAPEDKLQRLFKKYAKSKQTFSEISDSVISHPVLLSWASSHLPLYLPPPCPSIDPFPIHSDPHIL